jgi:hypothetical protein
MNSEPSTQVNVDTQNAPTPRSLHTPGPWKTCGANEDRCKCCQIFSIPADIPVAIASIGKVGDDYPSIRFMNGDRPGTIGARVEAYMDQIPYWDVSEEQAFANARLIAAAPELLAMLKSLSAVFNDRNFTDRAGYGPRIDALIAKAEGGSSVPHGNESR